MKGPQKIGGYTVLSAIGQGGMGAVYKVEKDNITYALKTILPDQVDMNGLARFEREALAAAAVDKHPNIVSVHKLELNAQPPFIVMDYVEGKSLDQHIKSGEPWPVEKVIEILTPLSMALDHLHSKGIIHRDLKPANILIRNHDSAPLITDFGLAKETNLETLTKTGEILGTPSFMAPEQLCGQDISPQTDIWALGVIAFNLLSGGENPFIGETLIQLANAILLAPAEFDSLAPESTHLSSSLQKALSKSPQKRYQSCGDFLDALKAPKTSSQSKFLSLFLLSACCLLIPIIILVHRYSSSDTDNKANREQLRSAMAEIKTEIRIVQKTLPQHYFEHLDAKFSGSPVLSETTQKECARLSSLRTKLAQFEQLFNESKIKNKKLRKQLGRWKELSESYGVLENSPEDNGAYQANTELEFGKFLQAYCEMADNPEHSEQILEYEPENIKWRPAWILMRAICATKRQKNSRAVKYLSLLQKEYPTLFPSRYQKALWQSKIRVTESRGKLTPRDKFRITFYHWRCRQLDPQYQVPKAYQQAFTKQGQVDVNYLNRQLDNLITQPLQLIFDITIDAADHGIYLDHLDDSNSRHSLRSKNIPEQSVRMRPGHGPSLFWRAYVQLPYSGFNGRRTTFPEILKNIERAFKLPLPSFQRAQLHGHRAHTLSEDRRNNAHKYDIHEVKKSCLTDIETALKLHHPRPHLLIHLKFDVLLQYYEATDQLKEKRSELFSILHQYLENCKKLYNSTLSKGGFELAIGRPPGIPYGRFNDNDLNLYNAEIAGSKASIYMRLQNWEAAETFNSQAFKHIQNFPTVNDRLTIFMNLKRVDKIKELQEFVVKESRNDPEKRRIYELFVKRIDRVLNDMGQK